MKEAGYPGFDVVAWFGMFAPAGTPKPIIARMNAALNAALAKPELKASTAQLGLDAFGSSPEELGAYVKAQLALWARLTADAGLKPE
jgi:tripartite-type tricarboxylate transporter receptor subunit TctC